MSKHYVDEAAFKNTDFRLKPIEKGEYTDCQFVQCSFANVDLSSIIFSDCEFIDCDLSNVKLMDTSFRNVKFISCKMLGVQFIDCREFLLQMSFKQCSLNYSTFHGLKIPKTPFIQCECIEVDFENATLTGSDFSESNLSGAVFQRTDLSKANLMSAENFSINPENNILSKSNFSRYNIIGLVNHLDINLK